MAMVGVNVIASKHNHSSSQSAWSAGWQVTGAVNWENSHTMILSRRNCPNYY